MPNDFQSTVLVVDDESAADPYGDRLADGRGVLTVDAAAIDRLDERADVVLLDGRAPDVSGEAVFETVRERGVDCRVAVVTGADADLDVPGMAFDERLEAPVSQSELRDAVDSLLDRVQYAETVRQYFELLSKRTRLEDGTDAGERVDGRTAAELDARIESLEADAAESVAEFTPEEFVAAFRDLDA